jgi:hypothetical protein
MNEISKEIIQAIKYGMKLEKEKHPDFDDDKHLIKVVVNLDAINERVQINFTKENQ